MDMINSVVFVHLLIEQRNVNSIARGWICNLGLWCCNM